LYNQKDVLNNRVTKLDATISKLEGR